MRHPLRGPRRFAAITRNEVNGFLPRRVFRFHAVDVQLPDRRCWVRSQADRACVKLWRRSERAATTEAGRMTRDAWEGKSGDFRSFDSGRLVGPMTGSREE